MLLAESPRIPGFKGPLAVRYIEFTMGFFDPGIFCAESAHLTALESPHIVKFLGYSTTGEGSLLLLNEYVGGGPIDEALAKRRFSPASKLRFCTQVAAGMKYLASHGVSQFWIFYSIFYPPLPSNRPLFRPVPTAACASTT